MIFIYHGSYDAIVCITKIVAVISTIKKYIMKNETSLIMMMMVVVMKKSDDEDGGDENDYEIDGM